MLGSRLDRRFRTRPLFETLLLENGLSGPDRRAVFVHTTKAIARNWAARSRFAVGEVFDHLFFRILARGRVPPQGMERLMKVGSLSWYQVNEWGIAQRARRAFGRVPRHVDCTTLYCGWRSQLRRGDPLPVFVLLDRTWQIREVAYADQDDERVHGLAPGIGPDLRASPEQVAPALRALAHGLGIEDFDDQLLWFMGK